MINELLSSCGLNKTEQEIFLFLAKHGLRPASLIAKSTGVNRSTVYSSLNSLVDRGFVNKAKQGHGTTFSAVSPKLLGKVIENTAKHRYSEIMLASARLPGELEAISHAAKQDVGRMEVTVFESVSAVFAHLEETLISGNFCAIFNPQTACEGEGRQVISRFLKRTSLNKPNIREIVVSGPDANWYKRTIKNPNHQIREIAKNNLILCDVILAQSTVLVTGYGQGGLFSIRMENKSLYQTFTGIFELLWSSLAREKGGR